jgi:hypothetical protein
MDENLPREEAQAVASALQQHLVVPVNPPGGVDASAAAGGSGRTRVGLIVYGRGVTVYQLGVSSGMAVGDVFPSHRGLADESILLSRPNLVDADSNHHLHGLMRCLSSVYGIVLEDATDTASDGSNHVGENRDKPLSRLEMLKRRKEQRILKQQQQQSQTNPVVPATSPWERRKEQLKAAKPAYRCAGEALQVAIDLASAATSAGNGADPAARTTSRILLFTNGCPNVGDGSVVSSAAGEGAGGIGRSPPTVPRRKADVVDPMHLQRAVEFFGVLGKAASEMGVAVDAFCCGALELALPAYHAIVEPSSGYVLSSPTFADSQFPANLRHVLHHTYVSGLHGTPLRDENWVDGCIVDVRMPRLVVSAGVTCLLAMVGRIVVKALTVSCSAASSQ